MSTENSKVKISTLPVSACFTEPDSGIEFQIKEFDYSWPEEAYVLAYIQEGEECIVRGNCGTLEVLCEVGDVFRLSGDILVEKDTVSLYGFRDEDINLVRAYIESFPEEAEQLLKSSRSKPSATTAT